MMADKMVNGESQSQWTDITQEFKDACSELDVGELLHDTNFGLFEAMSAFEMMDPKMDSGIIGLPSSQTSTETCELKTKDFSSSELLNIMDGTLCCITSWLEGGSMAQTIFANLYLQAPLQLEDRILKAFSLGVLKLVSICKDVITSTCVYEDEHFQPSTHGFHLADTLSESRVLGMLKEAEDDLGKNLRSIKSRLQEGTPDTDKQMELPECLADIDSVMSRIKIVKLFMSTIQALKYTGNAAIDQTGKGIEKLKEILSSLLQSIDGKPNSDPFDLAMFDISETSRLLPPSFPRAIQLMSLEETLSALYTMCNHLESIIGIPRKAGLVGIMDYFDAFTSENPSILVRSLLLYHFMPSGTGKVFNKVRLTELIVEELRSFSSPPIVSAAFKSTMTPHEHVKLVLNAFVASAAHVLENLFAAKCNTRARQRERLAFMLEELGVLQSEAERVDSVVDTILREKMGDKALSHLASGVGTWTLYLTTRTMVTYLTLGMELELYDIREYCYFFWYLSDVVYIWNTSSLFRAEKSLTEPPPLDSKSAGGKKKNKQKKVRNVVNVHQEELLMARCKQHISGGLYRLLSALKLASMLPTTGDYRYDNEEVRYTHRFAPFAAVNFPQPIPYHAYVEAVGISEHTPPYVTIDFLKQSYRNFETSRSLLEQDNLSKSNSEAKALLSVAKNNMVVTKILADSLQKDVKRSVRFDFSFHKVFPMIKFAT